MPVDPAERLSPPAMTGLPIDAVLPQVRRALADGCTLVLQAPPGAGKTTRVPLALLDEPWLDGGRIVVLEPRRLAARAAAAHMAALLGEPIGETVGYRIRLDSRVGPRTRIEVVTEGILTRRLQADPALSGIAAVLFDEFHERSLHADLGLALCLEAQAALRPDLRLVAMSATLDGEPLARLMGGAPIVTSTGRAHPVETRYTEPPGGRRFEDHVAASVLGALAEAAAGDVLAFLPGAAEIRRVLARLEERGSGPGILLAPLYGALPRTAQDAAIVPAPPGRRKVVLATDIAETSLTIEGVRVVVDGGLARAPRFDPRTGMTRLETVRVSQASADQRRGRAGRLGPGVCYRLWHEAEHRLLPPFTPPEIMHADLAPLALELAAWGAADPAGLAWLDPPPAAAFAQARGLLAWLGALDTDGRITPHGRRMAGLALHPRLAHMVLAAAEHGLGGLACDVAALLADRDVLRGADARDADLRTRLAALADPRGEGGVDRSARQQALTAARQWRRRLGLGTEPGDPARAGAVLALAYPDRVAQRRSAAGQFRLRNGRGAVLPPHDPLAAADWLAVADLDDAGRDARIFLAASLDRAEVEALFGESVTTADDVWWDEAAQSVAARRRHRLGALVSRDEPLADPPPERVARALLDRVRSHGLEVLPWTKALSQWQARVMLLRAVEAPPRDWPDVSDAALLDGLDDWLAPYLPGLPRRRPWPALDLGAALRGLLSWSRQRALDEAAPTHLTVPSGSRHALDYAAPDGPVLAVKLQEMFGLAETPRIAGGRVPVLLHLLSPAGRPVQVTRDLAGFWATGYAAVKADLKGRYPRHPWPDDPLSALPTARTKRRA